MGTKNILRFLLLVSLFLIPSQAVFSGPPPFCYSEIDGSPSGCYKKLKVSNGALTDNGDGSFTLTTGVGGGGDVSGGSSAIDREIVVYSGTGGKTIQAATSNQPTVSTAGKITVPDLTASRALTTDASKVLTSSSVTSTELGYLSGVTSAIQTQLDAKQAADADLTTWAGVTPSANGQSLVSAANYAAMRTLLDLEAGTDFYSIAAADAAFQPLEATLTDIADGTIVEDLVNTANPWADNEVADTITASNYLPLAGGTMTGELKIDETGIEGQPTDALTDCSTFSATGGGIFYDDSEGQWKKCEDNVLSDLDTGGGGGDSVSIDGAGVTDPDFVSTGQIDFVDTSNTVTANINDNSILEADLKAVDSATDEDILTYESTTGDFEWHTEDEIIATMSAGGLPNDSVLEADLKAVDAASDEECLTYETTTGDFEWQACGSGSGTTEYILPIYSAKITGTFALDGDATQGAQIDAGDGNWRLLFDATTDEGAVWQGIVPENFASVGVVDIDFSMTSGEASEVQFEAAIMCYTPGTDTADVGTASFATLGEGSATTVSATAGEVYRQSVTLTDDSCAAGDDFWIYVSTDADDATNDDATGDREVIGVKWNYA